MNVSPNEPFQIIYSLYFHEYLGDLFETYVVQKNESGKLTYKHQNISSKNATEFASGLDEVDFKIIKLSDQIQQDAVFHKFNNKKIKQPDFFLKIYDKEKGDATIQHLIEEYLDRIKTEILPLLVGKEVYIMGNDGEPAWKKVDVAEDPATILFHFMRNEENTHYFPTIKHRGEKVEFQYNNSQLISKHPAWLLLGEDKIIQFEKNMDGNKIKPFLNKKFIVVPKSIEDNYYSKFITQIVANYDVHAKGFVIKDEVREVTPVLNFKELEEVQTEMFASRTAVAEEGKIVFDLSFNYEEFKFPADGNTANTVKMEKTEDSFIFHKVRRQVEWEKEQIALLNKSGLNIRFGRASLPISEAFTWISNNRDIFEKQGYHIRQRSVGQRKYFIGTSSISIEVKENNDWFDVYAIVKFGNYEIPFLKLRNLIIKNKREFELPNGEIAVIPEEWLVKYNELLSFSEEHDDEGSLKLKKHHLALIHELNEDGISKVSFNKKLQKLNEFENIDDYELPVGFKGDLRNYQKAGYNWMRFLNEYSFGGCLADDMGLGKTVQTLALLQHRKEQGVENATLLVMPTSLIYNWEKEAGKFTPDLKILVYTGTYRDKNIELFKDYDLVISSYGIVRLDHELLRNYYFDYVILDESQAIKNPESNISHAVRELKSRSKLILTGTPIENSTMDLWSQMSFINDGLLGTSKFFKKNFLKPIEKNKDVAKVQKLYAIIKPFILRRNKDQVLTELPPKIEQVLYCEMTAEQEKRYEEVKSYYRNKILEDIDTNGNGGNTQFTLLQGLTKLRLIANHPKMEDEDYEFKSGKMKEVINTLESALAEHHKVLIFSQFVKHLSLFKERLEKKGIKYTYLDGSTKNRQAEVEEFQNNEDVRVFLISLKAGGLGLNLTKADYVFILDPWWNPAIEAQAVDRAHRMGQENVVHTYKFITKNSVEEKIIKLQESKKRLAQDLISTEDSIMKSLSKEDIRELLG
jgi:SNF2 family DNA or RNA helicase